MRRWEAAGFAEGLWLCKGLPSAEQQEHVLRCIQEGAEGTTRVSQSTGLATIARVSPSQCILILALPHLADDSRALGGC